MPFARRSSMLTLVLTAALSTAPASLAQPLPAAPVQVVNPNAALMYWPAWALVSHDAQGKFRDLDWSKIGDETDAAKMPEAFQEAAKFDLMTNVADDLVAASKVKRCDFEIKYDDGIMAIMPHLTFMRDGARLLRVAARQKLAGGDADTAARYVATMARSANQLAGDGVLISSLVGISAATAACDEARVVVKSGKLSGAARDELLGALRALDTADPLNARATLAFEGQVIPAYIERTFHGPEAGKKFKEMMGGFNEENAPASALNDIAKLDEAGMKAGLAEVRGVYRKLYAAWSLDTDSAAFGRMTEETVSASGPLTRELCPSFPKAFERQQKFRANLRETIKQVERYTPAPAK